MKRGILIFALCCYAINLFSQTNTNKGFLGIVIGPSIPLNEFADVGYAESPINYFAKTGYSSNLITFGYLFSKNFGISSSIFYNQYMIKDKR